MFDERLKEEGFALMSDEDCIHEARTYGARRDPAPLVETLARRLEEALAKIDYMNDRL